MTIDIMLIAYILEKPYLLPRREHGHTKGMDGRVAEPFIVEPAPLIQVFKVLVVRFGAEEVEVADLKVGEELAVVVFACSGVDEPGEVGARVEEVRERGDEGEGLWPEGGEGAGVVEDVHVEAVDEGVGGHEGKGVVGDGAEEVDLLALLMLVS